MNYIDTNLLRAVNTFASNEDVRYYLNGVSVTFTEKGCLMVATDGHHLAAVLQESETDPDIKIPELIIPSSVIRRIQPGRASKKKKARKYERKGASLISAYAEFRHENGRVTIDTGEIGLMFKPIDGIFPDWRKVLEKKNFTPAANNLTANPKLLANIWSFGKLFSPHPPVPFGSGDGQPILFNFSGFQNAFAVLMPMRVNSPDDKPMLPEWATREAK